MGSNPTMHRGIVKEVRSGDTLIVTGPPTQCPPVEVQITISGIIAPRLARRGGETDDAPYTWAAREHLRQLVIGKPIDFSTDGNFGDRQFSTCYFNGQNLALGLVTKGLVSCKDKGSGPEFEALQDAETEARANGLGVHCDTPNEFATRPEVDREFDVKAWHRKLPQGQPLTAIVEWVRDPCTLSCLIVPEAQKGGLGLWNGVDLSAVAAGGSSSLQPVQAVEVRSGDAVMVRTQGSAEPLMVSLASTNAPRMVGNRQRQEGQSDAPYSVEAKEWL